MQDSLGDLHACYSQRLPIDQAQDTPHLADCLALWRAHGALVPPKSSIDPTRLSPKTLPFLMILDVERNPLRFRYRLTGTRIDSIQNRNLSGSYVDQHDPASLRDTLLADMIDLVETGQPHLSELSFTNKEGRYRHVRALRLPLSAGVTDLVDHIFVAVDLDPLIREG